MSQPLMTPSEEVRLEKQQQAVVLASQVRAEAEALNRLLTKARVAGLHVEIEVLVMNYYGPARIPELKLVASCKVDV